MKKIAVLVLFIHGFIGNTQQVTPSESIFNGKNLEGWTILGPPANISVKEESMVLRMTTHTTRHAFIRTNTKYKDFIMELEFKRDRNLDSGILFRAIETQPSAFSSLFGYMVKIDPSATRLWTGGLFLDYGNGYNWLQTLKDNENAKNAEKEAGYWNTLRIEAIGSIIKVWLNNVPCVHIKDRRYKKGYIAFKIHYLRSSDEDKQALSIAFKDIYIVTKNIKRHQKPIALPLLDTSLDTEITYFR